jgi:hypothetical protein
LKPCFVKSASATANWPNPRRVRTYIDNKFDDPHGACQANACLFPRRVVSFEISLTAWWRSVLRGGGEVFCFGDASFSVLATSRVFFPSPKRDSRTAAEAVWLGPWLTATPAISHTGLSATPGKFLCESAVTAPTTARTIHTFAREPKQFRSTKFTTNANPTSNPRPTTTHQSLGTHKPPSDRFDPPRKFERDAEILTESAITGWSPQRSTFRSSRSGPRSSTGTDHRPSSGGLRTRR